ncbi:MAG TPA: glycoside hydrolase family 2 TIM barrel-domain containing protein, partial [Planctomycetota bacterium]|nr:glycoside hydrolase family 2 TIM barrel-domain containing protein [Planctomycetota bacterium]
MRIAVMVAAALCLVGTCRASHAFEFGKDVVRDSLDLNGTWEVFRGDGTEELWKPQAAADVKWDTTEVPGALLKGLKNPEQQQVRFVWARRSFTLDATHAARDVVLRWNGIRFGATAWINGTPVCEHTAVGPNTVLLRRGIVKAGRNELVLKVPGWAGVLKNKAGYPLMPTGAATQTWGAKNAAIFYDIWLEFYDDAYLKWVLAMPDVRKGTVTFRVWVDAAAELPGKVDVDVGVRPWKEQAVSGRGKATIRGGKSPVDIPVTVEDAKPWSLEERHLYEATLTATADGKVLDRATLRFGLRELVVKDGHYFLNGKRFRFTGSNLVNEWHWGDMFNENIKRYIVDEARTMSLNSFRTHTCPPPHLWLNVADEHGTLFLAEFPVLYNYQDFHFSKEDLEVWHRNALTDATGWVTTLWNHPAVVIWVLSNESPRDDAWESGPFRDHVVGLDPT